MPINRDLKILFIHIPKCAGTSLTASLNIDIGNKPRHKKNLKTLYGIDTSNKYVLQSLPLEYYTEYLDDAIIKTCLKITCVRNPYSRAVSDYIWHSRGTTSFLNFLKLVDETLSNNKVDELIKYNDIHSNHFIPQYKYIKTSENIEDDIIILKIENLHIDFKNKINTIFPNLKLKHLNKNIDYDYLDYYKNCECIEIVNRLYSKDFKMFNYNMII